MGNIYAGQAVAQAGLNIQKQFAERPERDARMAEAKNRQELSRMKLDEYKDNSEGRKTKAELELKQAQEQIRKLQVGTMQDKTTQNFRQYDADGDISHLNETLEFSRNSPFNMYKGTTAFAKVEDSPDMRSQAAKYGIKDLDGFFKEGNHKNYVTARLDDGSEKLINLDMYHATVGYKPQGEALERQKARQKQQTLVKYGIPYDKMSLVERTAMAISKEEDEPYGQVLERLAQRKTGSSAMERNIAQYMKDNPNATWFESLEAVSQGTSKLSSKERARNKIMEENPGMSREDATKQAVKLLANPTSTERDADNAAKTREKLHEVAGGDYFQADLNDPKMRRKIGPHVRDLINYTGTDFSEADKKAIRQFRSLGALGNEAGAEISAEQTGVLDSMMSKVQLYINDNVEEVKGRAAYETFRNTFRHMLYGSALSAAEISAFNNAVGTLGQQAGPVLEQLNTQMRDVQNQLQTVFDLNDEYVSHFYLGSSLDDLQGSIDMIDDRINMLSNSTQNLSIKDVQSGDKPPLDNIFTPIKPRGN